MRTSDFDYVLPPEFIAQQPASPRDASRLMILDRATGAVTHAHFRDLPAHLHPGDALVLNETRVLPARLHAHKQPGGGRVEILLLRRRQLQHWEALVGGKGLRPGRKLLIEGGPEAQVVEDLGGPRRLIRFEEPITPSLERIGAMPLPPYIHTPLAAPEQYQTVFARTPGSAAAPTAGLHFTTDLLETLKDKGVTIATVTLHIGLDTFAPVTEPEAEDHVIHTEWCQLDTVAAEQLNQTRRNGGRIVAVGTTSVRTLESAAARAPVDEIVVPYEGLTDLYILPGHTFRAVDALVTNFHLPRSTLLMLVSAFAGRQPILDAYEEAKRQGYRFYSFGDAMLIL